MSTSMRLRFTAPLAAVILTLGLAACGGHGALTTSTSAHKSAYSGSGSSPRSGEHAFAQSVNLTASDVPGFRAVPENRERETPAERRLQQKFVSCMGGVSESAASEAEQGSGQFRRQQGIVDETVSSSVTFLRDASRGAPEVALLRSPRTGKCLAGYLDQRYRGQRFGGVVIGHITIAQGVPPAPGTSGGFAWRIDAPLRVRGLTVPFYMDMLGFVYRQAEVRLVSSGLLAPFPASAEEQLYRLLLARARAHRL